jgi:hypothetical protein
MSFHKLYAFRNITFPIKSSEEYYNSDNKYVSNVIFFKENHVKYPYLDKEKMFVKILFIEKIIQLLLIS